MSAGNSKKKRLPLIIADVESCVSVTWSVDAEGTLKHNPTGLRVTRNDGVLAGGHEYRLAPEDIELDRNESLGCGASGVVQAGVHKPTGMVVAVKTVKVDDKEKRLSMLKEIQGLIQAEGCPYLVQWYAGFVGRDTGLVHIVVEMMDLGSLANLRSRLGDRDVPSAHLACITAQLIRGLRHLQSRHLLHRDVKPENILHNRAGEVKLTDFGISRDLDSTAGAAGTFVGSASYMAPERALGAAYSFESDVWSAGLVIFVLATNNYPYPTTGFLDLYEALCSKPEPRLADHRFPRELCDFVAACLTRDVMKRLPADKLCNHALVVNQGNAEIQAFSDWLGTFSPPLPPPSPAMASSPSPDGGLLSGASTRRQL